MAGVMNREMRRWGNEGGVEAPSIISHLRGGFTGDRTERGMTVNPLSSLIKTKDPGRYRTRSSWIKDEGDE
jgi:hypothetical protein